MHIKCLLKKVNSEIDSEKQSFDDVEKRLWYFRFNLSHIVATVTTALLLIELQSIYKY